jgi:hypothetical protein
MLFQRPQVCAEQQTSEVSRFCILTAVGNRKLSSIVYWREGYWLQGRKVPQNNTAVHVTGWRYVMRVIEVNEICY